MNECLQMLNVVTVESIYSAMCECQALHPDENDSLSAGSFLIGFDGASCVMCPVVIFVLSHF